MATTRTRRRVSIRALTFAGAVLALLPGLASAQGPSRHRPWPVSVRVAAMTEASVCPCVTNGTPAPSDRQLYIVEIGSEWRIRGDSAGFELAYAADLIPLILSRNTADERLSVWSCGSRQFCGEAFSDYPWTTAAYGAGILPIGFVARQHFGPTFALRLRGSGGAVYLSNPVPVMQSRHFNFVAEASLGAQIRVGSALAMTAGLTINHISNANTAPVNVGMDTRMYELGLTLLR